MILPLLAALLSASAQALPPATPAVAHANLLNALAKGTVAESYSQMKRVEDQYRAVLKELPGNLGDGEFGRVDWYNGLSFRSGVFIESHIDYTFSRYFEKGPREFPHCWVTVKVLVRQGDNQLVASSAEKSCTLEHRD